MKAFLGSPAHRARRAGLILLLTEKWLRTEPDEHCPADILTSGLNRSPAFPVLPSGWRILFARELAACYSGATVPEFHGVP